jgi:hypothetical protein
MIDDEEDLILYAWRLEKMAITVKADGRRGRSDRAHRVIRLAVDIARDHDLSGEMAEAVEGPGLPGLGPL